MDIKKIVISVAVYILAEKTNIIRKPDPMEGFISNLFGTETEQDRIVREIDVASDKAIESAKKFAVDRKFNKVIKNFWTS